jgi:hypothetical protein
MSVSRADANGAGSGSSPVSAPTTTDSAASTNGKPPTPGLADGPNTTWSQARKEHVRVAEASARAVSLDLKGINEALDDLEIAELRFVVANNKYAKNQDDKTREVYANAKRLYRDAQITLGLAIEKQTKQAGDSSLYPRGHGLKNCGEVRQREQKILDRFAAPDLKKHLEQAICENRSLRAPRELTALSAKMQAINHQLNRAQTKEAAHIIVDATDAVTGKREGDSDLAPNEVTKNKLDRLTKLLDAITTRVDGVTGNAQKFDPVLYDELTNNIRAQMGSLDAANNESFDTIVASYRDRLAPE